MGQFVGVEGRDEGQGLVSGIVWGEERRGTRTSEWDSLGGRREMRDKEQ